MAAIVALFCVSFTANATGTCYVYGSGSGFKNTTWTMTEITDSKGNGLDVWYLRWNFTSDTSWRNRMILVLIIIVTIMTMGMAPVTRTHGLPLLLTAKLTTLRVGAN